MLKFSPRCDGKLSKQEVKRGYKEVFGCELNDEELDDLFDRGEKVSGPG